MADRIGKPVSQRQLRVGEMIKQSLSMIFIKNEAKVPNLETNTGDKRIKSKLCLLAMCISEIL